MKVTVVLRCNIIVTKERVYRMKLKRILGSIVCVFSLMAASIGAQAANIPAHTTAQIAEQAATQTTTQTRTAVKINPQSADIYAEGIPATFPSETARRFTRR